MREIFLKYRTLWVLLAVQALCLAAGVWSQQLFLEAHAEWEAAQSAAQTEGEKVAAGSKVGGINPERVALHVFGFLWILIPQVAV